MKRAAILVAVALLAAGCRRRERAVVVERRETVLTLPAPGTPDYPQPEPPRELTPATFGQEFADDPEAPLDPKVRALLEEALRRGEHDPPVDIEN